MQARGAASLALLAGALACNGSAADTGFASGQPGLTSAPGSSETSTSGASSSGGPDSTTTSSEDSGAGSTEPLLDLGSSPDFGPDKPLGCQGKIDFLFVITREGNMHLEQARLAASFPGFIATIEAMFPGFDTHIMVANPDGTWPGWGCEEDLCKNDAPYCGDNGKDYACGPTSYEQITECDETLGAGILFNAGPYATNTPCTLQGGHRYITRDEPDPLAALECIARVGTYGTNPPLIKAMITALSPELNGPEGCNEGFLRDDALLFVTFITDHEDEVSGGMSWFWYKELVKAKHGDPNAIITLAVINQTQMEPNPTCIADSNDADPVRDLIKMFPYHVEGDICALSYAPYFAAAAELVGEACENFIPQ